MDDFRAFGGIYQRSITVAAETGVRICQLGSVKCILVLVDA